MEFATSGPETKPSRLPEAKRVSQNQAVAKQAPDAAPRVANSKNEFPLSFNLPLVGGPPEYEAPPVPPGYVPMPPATPAQDSRTMQDRQAENSVAWTSEPERWIPQRQSAVSTTFGPDPRMLPNPYVDSQKPDRQLPVSNPSSVKTLGDQVVAESTTMRPFNQYQGPSPAGLAAGSPDQQPELLPQQPVPNQSVVSAQKTTRNNERNVADPNPAGSAYPQTDFPGFQSVGHRASDRSRGTTGQGTGVQSNERDSRQSVMGAQQPIDADDVGDPDDRHAAFSIELRN